MGANAQTSVPTFTAGEVLTAANMNISARTGVPVFADTTARDAGFGGTGEKTLAEGQLCYLESTNVVQYYDGAAWATVGPTTVSSGLTVVKAETALSGVTTFTADNVFTSSYTTYRLVIVSSSGAASFTLQFRAGGVTTATNYNWQYLYGISTSVAAARTTSTTSIKIAEDSTSSTTVRNMIIVDIANPQVAAPTHTYSQSTRNDNAYTSIGLWNSTGNQSDSTQFDGLIVTAGTNGMTGHYTIYGYAKS